MPRVENLCAPVCARVACLAHAYTVVLSQITSGMAIRLWQTGAHAPTHGSTGTGLTWGVRWLDGCWAPEDGDDAAV